MRWRGLLACVIRYFLLGVKLLLFSGAGNNCEISSARTSILVLTNCGAYVEKAICHLVYCALVTKIFKIVHITFAVPTYLFVNPQVVTR
jgi:hypothetical protein